MKDPRCTDKHCLGFHRVIVFEYIDGPCKPVNVSCKEEMDRYELQVMERQKQAGFKHLTLDERANLL